MPSTTASWAPDCNVTRSAAEGFSLSEAQENALLGAIGEIERGDFTTLGELLASLPQRR